MKVPVSNQPTNEQVKSIEQLRFIENIPEAEDKADWKVIVVKKGDFFSKLVADAYGLAPIDYIKFVQKHNPEIEDINKIEIGQKIHFPPLDTIVHHRDTDPPANAWQWRAGNTEKDLFHFPGGTGK